MLLMEGNPQALANTMWAFAVMGNYEDDVVASLWDALVNCTDEEKSTMRHELYAQMYQVATAVFIEAPHINLTNPPPDMKKIIDSTIQNG